MSFKYEKQDITQFNDTGRAVLNQQLAKLWNWLKAAFDAISTSTGNTALETTANITIYANATTGNDDTGDGTAEKPYATLLKVSSVLPKIISHNVYIYLTGTFEEALFLNGRSGSGNIYVSTSDHNVSTASLKSVSVTACHVHVSVSYLTLTTAGYGAGIMSFYFSYVEVSNCTITQVYAGHFGIKASDGGVVHAQNNTISNCTGAGAAIQALRSGTVYSGSNTGSGNACGLYVSYGGTIVKGDTTQPPGTEAEKILTSGQIIPASTMANLTVYVNSSTGNDATGDGSSGSPFLTIAKALSYLPEIINHTMTINLTGTFAENIVISGKRGKGSIVCAGPGGTGADGTKASVTRLQVDTTTIPVSFYNITATTTDSIAFYAIDTKRLNLFYCTSVVSATTQTGVYAVDAEVRMENCTISNRFRALYANLMGRIYSFSTGGTGNTTGLVAAGGGVIYKGNTTQPAGTTAESFSTAGRIVTPT